MKKRHVVLIAVSLCLFVAGNAFALNSEPAYSGTIPTDFSGYTQDTDGVYNFDLSSFNWGKGDADWNHLVTPEATSGGYRLKLEVEATTYGPKSYYSDTNKNFFKAYQNNATGDYFWAIEDGGGKSHSDGTWGKSDKDNNDVYASASSAVPIPAAVWLFGSGLLGLVGIRKKVYKK